MTNTPDEITEARSAVADATTQLSEISELLLDGDPTVSASDLVAAEDELDKRQGILAKALDFRRRRQERDAERVRLARIAEFEELIRTRFGEHEGSVVAAFDAAVKALGPLVEAVQAHNAGLAEIVEELLTLQPLPHGIDPQRGTSGLHLPEVDVRIAPIDVSVLLAEACWRTLGAAGETKAANAIRPQAYVSHDRHVNAYLGIIDGDLSTPPKAAAPSDWLRRVARIVAERTA